ncbi:putative Ser/Thr protein phosphatase/nucleotidase [Catenaria anguillulae PL171]|uniref:Putative Ser/Thr protein phosphatase/nucleotidase n=1 Tax=Catenaria anguillulae PL171 TaxID=765915 RepID=A0A1Y2HRC0_9FUNG|nr:putative Ser/Thr protein phosphatase/nucleotidase [Catenaria anguillulae PL171]
MTIIHTNDLHAHFSEFSKYGIDCSAKDYTNHACYGGIARIKTVVERIRATEPNTYLLDAGDQFQGSLFYTYYKGNATRKWMNEIGYDAWSLGNHEFDDGPTHLAKFLKKLEVPTLSSNIDTSAQPELTGLVAPYLVLTKHDARIGLIGYITPTTPDIAPVDKVKFSDPVKPVQRAVDALHKLGVRRIICVSHNGYKEDIAVAQATRGIAVIVGGHSHTLLHSDNATYPEAVGPYPVSVKNSKGDDVFIVQAKAWGEFVGHLQLSWSANNKITHINGSPIHLTMDIPQHLATQALVDQWRAPFDAMAKQVIARFTHPMPYSECKTRGCRLGYLVADALRAQYRGKLPNTAHLPVIGMVPLGALRSSFGEVVTVGDVLGMLPYGDPWVETVVTGEYLVDLLENVAARKHKINGRPVTTWMQFAGLRAKVDRTKPDFERVSDVQVSVSGRADSKWAPIEVRGKYVVVAQEFLMSGGDNVVPETMPQLPKYGVMSDMLMAHMKTLAAGGSLVTVHDEVGVAFVN